MSVEMGARGGCGLGGCPAGVPGGWTDGRRHRQSARRGDGGWCPPSPARGTAALRPSAFPAGRTTSSEVTWAEHPTVSPGLPAPSRAPVRPASPRGLTDHTKWLPGELEPPLPAAVPAAAACSPDAHEVLHSEHHDGHDLLQGAQLSHRRAWTAGPWPGSAGPSPKPGTRAPQTCILDPGGPSVPNSNTEITMWSPWHPPLPLGDCCERLKPHPTRVCQWTPRVSVVEGHLGPEDQGGRKEGEKGWGIRC